MAAGPSAHERLCCLAGFLSDCQLDRSYALRGSSPVGHYAATYRVLASGGASMLKRT